METDTLTAFERAYIRTSLWSSTDDDGEPLDKGRDESDLAPAALDAIRDDCRRFVDANESLWDCVEDHTCSDGVWSGEESAAHDFWLTRNGHGAGFWDRPDLYGQANSDALTEASRLFGPCELVIGEDELIHCL